jgi:CRISPR-associated protein Csb2
MLNLGIRYLNGFVAACEPDSRERPEWPPHPGRVFMALAAAHFASPSDPAERQALLWLECLPPPHIYASGHLKRASVTHFVPVNDKSGPAKALIHSLPLTRDRQARTFTRAYLEDDTVYLSWPDCAPDGTVLNALDRLCQKVTRIGHSMSLVQMWIATPEELRAPNWVPDNQRAVLHLRVPAPGTLQQLERYYNAPAVSHYCELKTREAEASNAKQRRQLKKTLDQEFPDDFVPHYRPQLSSYQGYARAAAHPSRVAAPGTLLSPHLLLFTLDRLDGPYLHLDLPLSLGFLQYWRQALLAHCHNVTDEVRAIISGHQTNGEPLESPHLAFLPLGFVEHEHADGRLLGIAISLPHNLDPAIRREVLRVIGRVQLVRAGRLGSWRIERPTAASPPYNLVPETWTAYPKGATHWSTVTPMVFDRHPKEHGSLQYQRELAETVAVACQRMGLPQPSGIIPTAVSAHLGVPLSHAFPRLQRKDRSLRRHVHLILAFEEPVCGPILLGAGRYRGYGLLRPIHTPI